jgi:hypothetical protein
MRANRAYRLIVRRGSWAPDWLAPGRVDTVEVVEIDSGEVVLYWDATSRRARKLARALRTDLAGLQAGDFIARWQGFEP